MSAPTLFDVVPAESVENLRAAVKQRTAFLATATIADSLTLLEHNTAIADAATVLLAEIPN